MDNRTRENSKDEPWWQEEQIRYWQETTDHYLKYGTTFQAGIFRADDSDGQSFDDNNRTILTRSCLRSGQVVLDAGCGVGGPGLYAATCIPDLEIHGITISPYQAEVAKRLIASSQARDRVHIHVGDYHDLPFPENTFDCALFLESAGYSFQLEKLFGEIARVLRIDGKVYIKDVFCRPGNMSVAEWKQMEEFRRIYVQRTPTMKEMVSALEECGFSIVSALDITPMVLNKPREIEFGLPRFRTFPNLPFQWGEIVARRTAGQESSP